jgi:S-DNA-T family DNA segregation ATPase FtsK/SpoIIIE
VVLLFLSGLLHLELTGIPTISSGMVQKGMAGGAIGQLLADNLRSSFASTGAHILILSGLLVSLLLATPVSLTDLWRRLPEWWISVSETVAALLPERAAPSEKVKQVKPKPVRINRTSLPDSIEQDHAAPEIASAPLPRMLRPTSLMTTWTWSCPNRYRPAICFLMRANYSAKCPDLPNA